MGKGLQALIPVKEEALHSKEGLLEIDIEAIRPAQHQARRVFDQEKLAGLAVDQKTRDYTASAGKKLPDGRYELIAVKTLAGLPDQV